MKNSNDSLQIKGRFKMKCIGVDGLVKWEDENWISNIMTNVGKAAIAGLVGNTGAVTAFNYIALGSSATAVAATDTTLNTEISTNGLARTTATVSRVTTTVTNDTVQFANTFSCSGANTINEIGILNAASVGILLCHALTGARTVANLDQVVVTYQVIFT